MTAAADRASFELESTLVDGEQAAVGREFGRESVGRQSVGREFGREFTLTTRRKFPCTVRVIIFCVVLLFLGSIILTSVEIEESGIIIRGKAAKVIGGPAFSVLQYNILASYLADNGNPWFLLPLDLNQTYREQIQAKYETQVDGKWVHSLWTNCYDGLLSEADCEKVKAHQQFFDWSGRGPRLMDTIRSMDADIFSLVELDKYDDFVKAFPEYGSTYAKRPKRRSKDGSSVFWRHDRFEAVGEPIHFFFKDWSLAEDDNLDYKWSNDRVMTAVSLREKKTRQILLVVSMHLMKNPEKKENDPLRMLEVSQAMHEVDCLKVKYGAVGMIILGDLNAFPGSWTHVFILHGWQSCQRPDWKLQDVFSSLRAVEPERCTSRTKARKLWIDYIIYSHSTMSPVGSPEVDECPEAPMPSDQHPSDHLPVRATFEFKEGATVPARPPFMR